MGGTRRIEVTAGHHTIKLVCESDGVGSEMQNLEAELTAMFFPNP